MQVQNTAGESSTIKRRTSTAEMRMMHVESWKHSGLTMTEYCRRNDVGVTRLSAWSQNAKHAKKLFKAVVVKSPSPEPIRQIGVIEIVVGSKLKIRLVDTKTQLLVVDLVKELMRCNF